MSDLLDKRSSVWHLTLSWDLDHWPLTLGSQYTLPFDTNRRCGKYGWLTLDGLQDITSTLPGTFSHLRPVSGVPWVSAFLGSFMHAQINQVWCSNFYTGGHNLVSLANTLLTHIIYHLTHLYIGIQHKLIDRTQSIKRQSEQRNSDLSLFVSVVIVTWFRWLYTVDNSQLWQHTGRAQ